MTTPRTTRSHIPTPGALSLTSPRAVSDLTWLGWWNSASVEVLWALSGAADADLALNSLYRLMVALDDHQGNHDDIDHAIRTDPVFRVRLFALLGASSVLGDHLIANPTTWHLLRHDAPTRRDMLRELLGCIGAAPAGLVGDTATDTLDNVGTYRAAGTGTTCTTIETTLKQTYRPLLMRIAAIDLAGTSPENSRRVGQPEVPLGTVTAQLADLADAALTAALAVAIRHVYGDNPVESQLAVIAMGKCGARELNYISDVDVVFVAEPADAAATRVASELIRIGSHCFFEVDAALRPEGKHGALVRTLESHVTYYRRWAETWEFQALLKHRPMTGYLPLGRAYSDVISPLVWQASQRDSFVADIQAMRRRVLENVPEAMKHRELKLGEGGLRDVEFAVQLLQLVHGRYDETLRTPATIDALAALIESGYVGREDGANLIECYEFLRSLEHRLQLQKVKRTHTLPAESDYQTLRWLAHAAGFRGHMTQSSVEKMLDELRKVRLSISSLHHKLFYRPLLDSVVNLSVDTIKLSATAAKEQLRALGYLYPDRAFEHLTALAAGANRKAKIQAMLLPTLMEWLSQTADPDAGLLNYRKLSDAANDRQWFLRMLRDEGVVGQRLMKILGNSPYVSDLIIATPDSVKLLGDGARGPKLLDASPTTVSSSLCASVSRHKDPDRAITVARSLRRAELARVAAADLLDMMDVQQVCRSLSFVWDAVLEAALAAEIRASVESRREGNTEGAMQEAPARIAVIGMGRLGGAELGYGSDADVMFVCEPAPGVDDNEAVRWAIGVCDRMRRRLSKPSGDPPLEVDLGLRPEGRSGAVVRTIDSYVRYYEKWGETWEIQALLRATHIAGDKDVGLKFLAAIDSFRYPADGASPELVREVRRMKARVDNERLPRGADRNTHTKLGRGALTDIEWTVQLLILLHAHEVPELHNTSTLECLDVIEYHKLVDPEKVKILRTAWLTATDARNALVLVRGKRTDQLPPPGPHLAQVAGAAGWDPTEYQEFLENYLKVTRRARQVVDEVFWGEKTFEP